MLLKGLKVVEFATYIAAPGAAGILGDWGAEVTKVERAQGDPMRNAFADAKNAFAGNPTFAVDNRGKRAVALDTSKPAGRDALAKLAASADVFITNVRPAALKRSGLDEATLRAANPRLVYAAVTGYGLEGPDADKPGFDVTAFWSRAGVARMHTPKGSEPFILRTGVGDHTTSLATVSAILAALYEREQTGQGRYVQTSLLATGIYTVSSDMAVQLSLGRLASNRSRKDPFDPLANFYQSRDEKWFVLNPRSGNARKANAMALVAELEAAFGALDFEEIAKRLNDADQVWAPVQTPAEVAADPQAAAAGAWVEVEDGQGGTYRSPAAPALFPGAEMSVRPAYPAIGQHTKTVLGELGYSAQEIDAMIAEGAAA